MASSTAAFHESEAARATELKQKQAEDLERLRQVMKFRIETLQELFQVWRLPPPSFDVCRSLVIDTLRQGYKPPKDRLAGALRLDPSQELSAAARRRIMADPSHETAAKKEALVMSSKLRSPEAIKTVGQDFVLFSLAYHGGRTSLKSSEGFDDCLGGLADKYEMSDDDRSLLRAEINNYLNLGIKIWGCYASADEAKAQMEAIAQFDNTSDIWMSDMYTWLIIPPDEREMTQAGRVTYTDPRMNAVLKSYAENKVQKDIFERERRRMVKEQGEFGAGPADHPNEDIQRVINAELARGGP